MAVPKEDLHTTKFRRFIFDEAGQATAGVTLVVTSRAGEQLVLFGGPFQLPPTVQKNRAKIGWRPIIDGTLFEHASSFHYTD